MRFAGRLNYSLRFGYVVLTATARALNFCGILRQAPQAAKRLVRLLSTMCWGPAMPRIIADQNLSRTAAI